MKYLIIIPILIMVFIILSEIKDTHPEKSYSNGIRQGIHIALGIVCVLAIILMQVFFDY